MPTLTKLASSSTTSSRVLFNDYIVLIREFVLCGGAVLVASGASDRLYYSAWVFPPYQWLHYNLSQDLAIFYGQNDFHYYITQGLPLLLLTFLPFALVGLWKASFGSISSLSFVLSTIVLTNIASLSFISHKEVRFIYPLLPILHLLAVPTFTHFFQSVTPGPAPSLLNPDAKVERKTKHKKTLALMIVFNIILSAYGTQIHQRGVLSVVKFVRLEYEGLAFDRRGVSLSLPEANRWVELENTEGSPQYPIVTDFDDAETIAAFLMPCHSVPWRSKLVHPGLHAWALTCEPPIDIPAGSVERANYRDEADRFFDDPVKFLRTEVNTRERPWPRYVVGFEGIESAVREYYETDGMPGFKMQEKWRGFNSHWHDDPRRQGDVVVWEFVDGSKVS
jgi:phosphatidylinositol glycan class B